MTFTYYVNENQSDIRAIKPGWYGLERNGKLSSGPFSNQGKCLTGIFRASPWLRRTIKCPECGGEHVRPCIRVDEHGREWIDNSCEVCGHKLSLEEMGRQASFRANVASGRGRNFLRLEETR
jgi:predicted RNA-binding Zn-ribbon protein involved in translation (DUF1610 family)